MTRTASTTSTAPKMPAVIAVLRLGAFFVDARLEAAPPDLAPLAPEASGFPR